MVDEPIADLCHANAGDLRLLLVPELSVINKSGYAYTRKSLLLFFAWVRVGDVLNRDMSADVIAQMGPDQVRSA
jgi:hypothetical protein